MDDQDTDYDEYFQSIPKHFTVNRTSACAYVIGCTETAIVCDVFAQCRHAVDVFAIETVA